MTWQPKYGEGKLSARANCSLYHPAATTNLMLQSSASCREPAGGIIIKMKSHKSSNQFAQK